MRPPRWSFARPGRPEGGLSPLVLVLAAAATGCRSESYVLRVSSENTPAADAGPAVEAGAPVDLDAAPALGDGAEAGNPALAATVFRINSARNLHIISRDVYGYHYPEGTRDWPADRVRPGLLRTGSPRVSTHNWEISATNAGLTSCVENTAMFGAEPLPGDAIRRQMDIAEIFDAAMVVSLPIGDWVAADRAGSSPPPMCSGDVRKSGPDYLTRRFHRNRPSKNAELAFPPLDTDDSVYQDEFVRWLRQTAIDVGTRVIIGLDRAPDTWVRMHPEVRAEPIGYEELCTRSASFAASAKAMWPEAAVSGFSGSGFLALWNLANAPDEAGKGLFVDYYLDCMRRASEAAGRRLLDVLDFHWRPEGKVNQIDIASDAPAASDEAVASQRVQAPRSFWDEGYVENSFIVSTFTQGPVRLFPWLRERIAEHFPGTRIAVSEYSFGGGGHISGAIAVADAIGVFGREDIAYAALRHGSGPQDFALAGLQAFRNFDGRLGRFQDVSIEATTNDPEGTSIYASLEVVARSLMVLVAINKKTEPVDVSILIDHGVRYARGDVWTLTQTDGPTFRSQPAIQALTPNHLRYRMPARSVVVLVPRPLP